ncbi:hypothetical protein AWC38_SpisGene2324 [Stylophora pistillata]|uniref:Uncharacterized protein n=1 Tax=Stylophora pistillata TaxID=50429 RepID=A0A2B4SU13_STYPI|nr:hypothetical protein AWC38_SpisGene2324 [Stylophora pistillata]
MKGGRRNLLLNEEDIISIVCTSKANALFTRKQAHINKMQVLHALLLTVVVLSIFIHDVTATSDPDISSTDDEHSSAYLRSLAARRFKEIKRGNNLCGFSYYGCPRGRNGKRSWMSQTRNMRSFAERR